MSSRTLSTAEEIATGKSNRARSILPPVSLYCVSVRHLQSHDPHCSTVWPISYYEEISLLNFLCVENINYLKSPAFYPSTFLYLTNLSSTSSSRYSSSTRLSSVIYVSPSALTYTTHLAPSVRRPGANWYEVPTVVYAKVSYLTSCPVAHSQQ